VERGEGVRRSVVQYEVLGMDLSSCEALACSEVRAARAAECSSMSFEWAKKSCSQTRAVLATSIVLGQDKGAKCVSKVFGRCYGSSPDLDPLAPARS
jgi:Peptidase M76 family